MLIKKIKNEPIKKDTFSLVKNVKVSKFGK